MARYQEQRTKERPYNYEVCKRTLTDLLNDLDILAGNKVGPSGVSWQDVLALATQDARALATMLDSARHGGCFNTFPCPEECLEVSRA